MKHCTTMPEVRAEIDALDDRIAVLVAERTGYMTQAARIKGDAAQVRDEARIAQIVDRMVAKARDELHYPPEVAEAMWRALIEASIAFEHREFARLQGSNAAHPRGEAEVAP